LDDVRVVGAFISGTIYPTPGKSYTKMIRGMARGTTYVRFLSHAVWFRKVIYHRKISQEASHIKQEKIEWG
jgi:hypothetical protein